MYIDMGVTKNKIRKMFKHAQTIWLRSTNQPNMTWTKVEIGMVTMPKAINFNQQRNKQSHIACHSHIAFTGKPPSHCGYQPTDSQPFRDIGKVMKIQKNHRVTTCNHQKWMIYVKPLNITGIDKLTKNDNRLELKYGLSFVIPLFQNWLI
jgi:hypothetical protein